MCMVTVVTEKVWESDSEESDIDITADDTPPSESPGPAPDKPSAQTFKQDKKKQTKQASLFKFLKK